MGQLLSVVVSVYNEEAALNQFYQVTAGVLMEAGTGVLRSYISWHQRIPV